MKKHPRKPAASPRPHSKEPPFRDLHELAEILGALGQHLHAKNRIALGESGFYWHIAETLRSLARLSTLPVDFPAVDEAFGDAYSPGTMGDEQQTQRFLALIASESPDTDVN